MSEENTNTNENENVETTENQNNEQENTTFTQSEVDSQISKAVDSALKKQQAKLEKDKQKAIEDAKKDAEEYSKMTQKQKDDAEYDKRIKALEKREQELNNKQLLSEIQSDLKENELPGAFAESLLSLQDNEKIKEQITTLKSAFDEAVKEKVKESLRQDTPKGNTGKATGITKEQFGKMSYSEKVELFNNDIETYNKLAKGD